METPSRKRSCCGYSPMCKVICCSVSTIVCLTVAILTPIIFRVAIHKLVPEMVYLTKKAKSMGDNGQFPMWQTQLPAAPDDMFISFYMYNMTNPTDVLRQGSKPNYTEVGPFYYSMGHNHYNLSWSGDEDELGYKEWAYYWYVKCPSPDPDVPCSDLEENMTFTLPNLAFYGLYHGVGSALDSNQLIDHALQTARAHGDVQLSEFEELFSQRKPHEHANLAQRLVVDTLWMLPGLRDNKTIEEIEVSLLVTPMTPTQAVFGYDHPLFRNLSNCEFGIWDDVCGILDHEATDCDAWFDGPCKTHPKIKLECSLLKSTRFVARMLMKNCPNAIKQAVPPRFPGIGFINDTNDSAVDYPAGVDRTNVVKTGAVDSEHGFEYTKRFGMEIFQVCDVQLGNPGLPCAFGGEAKYPYKTPEASRVRGLSGLQTHAFVSDGENFSYWVDAIARAINIHPSGEKIKHRGIETIRYKIDDRDLQNVQENPDNDVYYSYGPSGYFNLTSMIGFPMLLSQPHFLDVHDGRWRNNLDGISLPDPKLHQFNIDIEPITGMIVHGSGKLQLNTIVEPIEQATIVGKEALPGGMLFSKLDKFDFLNLPVLWLNQGGSVGTASAKKWHGSVGLAMTAVPVLMAVFFCLAGFSLAMTICVLVRARKSAKKAMMSSADMKAAAVDEGLLSTA